LPSGTRRCPLKILGAGAVLYVPGLIDEIRAAGEDASVKRLAIDPHAMVIEDADREFEVGSLKKEIASTGQGVGVATARKILRTSAARLTADIGTGKGDGKRLS